MRHVKTALMLLMALAMGALLIVPTQTAPVSHKVGGVVGGGVPISIQIPENAARGAAPVDYTSGLSLYGTGGFRLSVTAPTGCHLTVA